MKCPKSHKSLEKLLEMMSNYVGAVRADDLTSESLNALHERMEKGCLAIKIAHDMGTLNTN